MIKIVPILFALNLLLFSQNIEKFLSSIESESTENRLELLSEETWQNRSKNPMYAIECANIALELAVGLSDDSKLAELNNYLGVIYRNIANYTKALQYYNYALEIAISIHDSVQIAYSYNNIGGAYRLERNYTVALVNMYKALEIFEKLGNKEGIGFCVINIGIVYKLQGNYDKAMEYFSRSIAIREELGDQFGKALSLNQIVEVSYENGDFETALIKYNELLKIYEELNDTKGIAVALGGIGGIKYHQKKFRESKEYRERSLNINREIENTEGILINLNQLALVYLKLGDKDEATNAIAESRRLSLESGHSAFLLDYFLNMSTYYEEKGELDSALIYIKKFSLIKDSLAVRENMETIASMESLYQVDLAAKENKLLQNQNNLRNEQAIFLVILAVVLISFVSFFLIKYFQNKNMNSVLKELNATKDKFFSIVAHDLKNPFNNLLGYSELLVSDYENMTEAERKQAVIDLNASSKKLVALVDNLLQWARANIGSLQYNPKMINMFLFFRNLFNVFDEPVKQKNLIILYEIDPDIEAYIDEDYLNLVMRNLLSNAIKFSHPKGKVKFRVNESNNSITIEVIDQGVGIDVETQKMLFDLGQNVSTTGTLNEKGTGLGLILAHDLVIKWGGTITVQSELGIGSTFTITIPKTKLTS